MFNVFILNYHYCCSHRLWVVLRLVLVLSFISLCPFSFTIISIGKTELVALL